jgi:CxxC motif-containing protein (DUF1111 family)
MLKLVIRQKSVKGKGCCNFPTGITESVTRSLIVLCLFVTALHVVAAESMSAQGDPRMLGGDTTILSAHSGAFSKNAANMSSRRKGDFLIGNDFFEDPWVIAPATTDLRDGLGPLFNVSACQSCHFNDGRGHAPESGGDNTNSLLIRLSRPAASTNEQQMLQRPDVGNLGDPVYGGQLQDRSIPEVMPEVNISVAYQDKTLQFADGYEITLRYPVWKLTQWGYGLPHKDTTFSIRVAPPVIGLGLLEAIPESLLADLADPEDANNDGISGRINRVWDVAQKAVVMGRFGWKAGQPTVRQQAAGAFNGDMGLTTTLFPKDHCTSAQPECQQALNGNGPEGVEVRDDILNFVSFYARNLAVPARRDMDSNTARQGEELFIQSGCRTCHAGPYRTNRLDKDRIEQSEQIIYPYTDLLLHDMGKELADLKLDQQPAPTTELVEFTATSREWRTPPLWGIGLSKVINSQATFLHDGRARTLLEAVLWHGGEAAASRDKVLAFSAEQRLALTSFLNSL